MPRDPLAEHSAKQPAVSVAEVAVIIPTYNAAKHWTALSAGLQQQGLQPSQILVIDSSSSDGTRDLAAQCGHRVVCIRKEDFNHGATRQLACTYLLEHPYLVFMTQDAILAGPDSIKSLCQAFMSAEVGAIYGRQLPRPDADPIERHGRLFNYPCSSQVRALESRRELGFRTVFFSNSFAAYRRSALDAVGGFPVDGIVSEEVTVAARMLLAGWKIVYEADSQVLHSHPLSLTDEFSRYFDIGVQHGCQPWIRENFGGARGEGSKFLKSQFRFLFHEYPLWIPYAVLRTISKFIAYSLGQKQRFLPTVMSRWLSSQPGFWVQHKKTNPREEISVVQKTHLS